MAKGYPPEFRRRVLDLLAAGGASQRSPETLAEPRRVHRRLDCLSPTAFPWASFRW